MNIGNCELLDAIGSSSPMYYIVGWNASQEEINSKIIFDPFSNEGNRYLHSNLSSLGIANSVRFNKVLKFNNVVWNPSENQLNLSRKQLNQDILESNPRVIIALGGKVAEFLLGNKFVSLSNQAGKNLKCEIDGKEFSLVITYSPEFLVKDNNENNDDDDIEDTQSVRNRQKFINDILYAGKIANGEISDLSAKKLVTAKTYYEFYNYYENYLKDAVYVAYDIETNAQPVHFDTFRIIGFSLSPDPMSGIYVIRESLDYVIPDSDWDKIVKLAVSILDSHKIIVHNCMYEIPSTLNNWKYRIKEFDDTMIMSRLLLGGKTGAGLKEQCQINLGYPEWEEDLTLYRETMDHFRNIMKPTPAGKKRWYYTFMVEHNYSLSEMKNELSVSNNEILMKLIAEKDAGDISQDEYEKKVLDKIVNSKESEVLSKIVALEGLIRNYYPDDSEFEEMMYNIGKEMVDLVESNNFGFMPYSSVPSRLLSKYGAIDAVGTRELFDNLSDKLNKESTEDVDLWNGYRIMKAQFRVAVSMEMNGLYWDDNVAESEYKWFNAKAIESIQNLINSGYIDDKIFWNCRECWIRYLIDNNPDELKNLIGEDFYLTTKGIKKVSGGREILFRNISSLISESYWNEIKEFLLNYVKKIEIYKEDYKWFSDYKYIYNPASPKQEEFLTSIVVTDDIRIANVIYLFTLILEDRESGWENYSDNDRKPFELLKSIQDYNADVSKYNDTEEGQKNPKELISNNELFNKFKELISTQIFYSKDLNQKLIDGLNYKLENAREGSILFLYKLYTIVGKDDIEKDRSTWTPEFRFLVDFRSYKKCIKMMTTYITGSKVGRGSVTEVSREDIDNNIELPLRHSYYSGNKSDSSEYLMQSNFNVTATETFRWRSGHHTIPGDATIKNIYRSRYKGGVIFAPDYSQAEIRMIAGLSNCKTMIDAFINGMDIHKFNASKIFQVPLEEVTSAQRRYSKMFSFSILYGSTPEGAANDYLNGDVALAKSIFDDFYKAFPEIKDFIADMHDRMHKYGKVPVTKTGMFIKIDPSDFRGDVHKAERAAQNYPVQSCSSNVAGYVLSKANDYILDNNMRSKTILFIHDSLEFDVYPYDMLDLADYLIHKMNDIPMQEFGVPMKIDLALGVSMGQEVEMSNLELSEDKRSCTCVIEGLEEDFDLLVENWKDVYSVVEWEDIEEPSEIYIPKGNLFLAKVAISHKLGKKQREIKRKVKIAY